MNLPEELTPRKTHGNVKFELLETIQLQEALISQQSNTIFSLVNENIEQESLIGELMRKHID